jgi:hypothetical protein
MMMIGTILFCLTFDGESVPTCAPPDFDPMKVWLQSAQEPLELRDRHLLNPPPLTEPFGALYDAFQPLWQRR